MPNLREEVTYKNTSACSIQEIKALIDEMKQQLQIPDEKLIVDYTLMRFDNLWYLRQIPKAQLRNALISAA